MNKLRFLLGTVCIFAALTFTSCENTTTNTHDGHEGGAAGDSANNMNNGGNYTPDVRTDNPEGHSADSTVGTTGIKFDAQGNAVDGNNDINSNRQQDATTGGASNTEKRKQGE